MSANDGRLGNLRVTFTICAAVLFLATHGTALSSEATRSAVAASSWDEPARQVASLIDSPFLVEPPFPRADDSAKMDLAVAGFMAEAPLSRASLAARIAALGPSTAELEEELNCLALNIYHEARNEPEEGQVAVAHVVLNRISDPRFPATACKVIRQGGEQARHRCQFSWWCDGRSDQPRNLRKWQAIKAMAEAVFWGRSEDPTGGALWYHADYVSPHWGRVFKRSRQIGRHIFYLDRSKPARIASRATQTASAP